MLVLIAEFRRNSLVNDREPPALSKTEEHLVHTVLSN